MALRSKKIKQKALGSATDDKDAFVLEDGREPECLDEVLKILEDRYAEWMMRRVGLISNDKEKKKHNPSSACLPKLRVARPSLDNLLLLASNKEKEAANALKDEDRRDSDGMKKEKAKKSKKNVKDENAANKHNYTKHEGSNYYMGEHNYNANAANWGIAYGEEQYAQQVYHQQSIAASLPVIPVGTVSQPSPQTHSYGYSSSYLTATPAPAMPSIPEALELDSVIGSHQESPEDFFASLSLDAEVAAAGDGGEDHSDQEVEMQKQSYALDAELAQPYAYDHQAYEYYAPASTSAPTQEGNSAYDLFMNFPYPEHSLQP
jgi:hypothetical protein